jgi:hypothetical protein
MSKKTKRPGRVPADVHERILDQVATIKRDGPHVARDADELPEVAALLEAGRIAVGSAVPSSMIYEGRTYWLRVSMVAHIDVFSDPGARIPLVHGVTFNTDAFGHVPGH